MRRKGERRVRVYETDKLLALFECADVYELMAKLRAQRLDPYVLSSPWYVSLSDYQLPES